MSDCGHKSCEHFDFCIHNEGNFIKPAEPSEPVSVESMAESMDKIHKEFREKSPFKMLNDQEIQQLHASIEFEMRMRGMFLSRGPFAI